MSRSPGKRLPLFIRLPPADDRRGPPSEVPPLTDKIGGFTNPLSSFRPAPPSRYLFAARAEQEQV